MKKLLLNSAVALSLMSSAAIADTGPFVEANLGYSGTGASSIDRTQTLVKTDSNHFGYNVNAGILFLGLGGEVGYTRYSDIQYQDNTGSAPADLYGIHAAFKVVHDIGPLFVMGKVGYGQLHRGSFRVNDASVDSEQKSGLYFGFGAGVDFTPTLAVVAQYQQTQGSGDLPTANLTSVGINWTI